MFRSAFDVAEATFHPVVVPELMFYILNYFFIVKLVLWRCDMCSPRNIFQKSVYFTFFCAMDISCTKECNGQILCHRKQELKIEFESKQAQLEARQRKMNARVVMYFFLHMY